MSAQKFTRNRDYSDEADNNAGGRDTVDPAGLDGEMDEIVTTTDDHADKLDLLLRSDLKMIDDILQGHEFSAAAITILKALIGTSGGLNWHSAWVTATAYAVGDLVKENGNAYICLVAHTSGTFATDLAALKWEIFVEKGAGASFPGSSSANDLLYSDGATEQWGKLTAAMAPLFALLADPTFTGVVGLPDVNISGRFNLTATQVAQVASGNNFDFDGTFLKAVTMTTGYTGVNTAINVTRGDMQEIHFYNSSGSSLALLWHSNWTWMGYAPSSIAAGKKAVLSLRAPTGSATTDIIAMWSVEP